MQERLTTKRKHFLAGLNTERNKCSGIAKVHKSQHMASEDSNIRQLKEKIV